MLATTLPSTLKNEGACRSFSFLGFIDDLVE
jgi:hypothetical protein